MKEYVSVQDTSSNFINMTLVSIKDSMEHLEDVVSDMAETLESLSVNTFKEMT